MRLRRDRADGDAQETGAETGPETGPETGAGCEGISCKNTAG
jgi:hypothetical protein